MRMKQEAPGSLAGDRRGRSALVGSFVRQNTDPLDRLLDRLDSVRPAGKGWVARCPAHKDNSPSLALDVGSDGETVLLHCFAGCSAIQVVSALGYTLADLFPSRPSGILTGGNVRSRIATEARWKAAAATVMKEATIIQVAAADLMRGANLGDDDRARLALAAARIEAAWEVLHEHSRRN